MILLDANVLVALADFEDELNPEAEADLEQVGQDAMFLTTPVLAEAYFLLPWPEERDRLLHLIDALDIQAYSVEDERALWAEVNRWLLKYAEHRPDWVDGSLAVLCGRDRGLKVWTYDEAFATVWRRPDGTKIPLAVKGHR